MSDTLDGRQVYQGEAKSRKELAASYNVHIDIFNAWLKELIKAKRLDIGRKRYLKPKEITVVINECGDFRTGP